MAAQTTQLEHLDAKPYKAIDPETLTPEQRALWNEYRGGPLKAGETSFGADQGFCYILELHGIPLDPPYRS